MRGRKRLQWVVLGALALTGYGASTYFWFTLFVRGRSVTTPSLIGRSLAETRAITSDLGLMLEIDEGRARHSDAVPASAVVWQNREPGSLVKRGTRIYVAPSLGPLLLTVPDLTGQSPRTALLRFNQRSLTLGNLSMIDLDATPGVVAEMPPRGTVVSAETPISLLVATEPAPPAFLMPDLINRPVEEVRRQLERHGLPLGTVRYESYPGIPDGTIIRQFPLPGWPVHAKSTLTLVVSRQAMETFIE